MIVEPEPDHPVLGRFARIQAATECVYAPGARLVGVEGGEPGTSIVALAHALAAPGVVDRSARVDGIVYEISDAAAGATVDELRRTTGDLLRRLAAHDGSPAGTDPDEVLVPGWWFRFGATPYFVSAFGPCYPATSSRYAFGTSATYILFLTAESFVRRRRGGEAELPHDVKVAIRTAYANAGRPYDLALTLSVHEAHRIVKPATYGAPPVRWWEE